MDIGTWEKPVIIGSNQQYEKMKKTAEEIDEWVPTLVDHYCRIIRYDCIEDTKASSKEDHIRNICHMINISDIIFVTYEPDGSLSDDLVYISEYVEHSAHVLLRYLEATDEITTQINEDRRCAWCRALCNPVHIHYITGSENKYLTRADRHRNRKAIYAIPTFRCMCEHRLINSWDGKPIPVRDKDGNDITKYIGIFDSLC